MQLNIICEPNKAAIWELPTFTNLGSESVESAQLTGLIQPPSWTTKKHSVIQGT